MFLCKFHTNSSRNGPYDGPILACGSYVWHPWFMVLHMCFLQKHNKSAAAKLLTWNPEKFSIYVLNWTESPAPICWLRTYKKQFLWTSPRNYCSTLESSLIYLHGNLPGDVQASRNNILIVPASVNNSGGKVQSVLFTSWKECWNNNWKIE